MKIRSTMILFVLTMLIIISQANVYAGEISVPVDQLLTAHDENGEQIPIGDVDEDSYDGFICVLKDDLGKKETNAIEEAVEQIDDQAIADIIVEDEIISVDDLDTIENIMDSDDIDYIEPDYLMEPSESTEYNDPFYKTNSWVYDIIDIRPVWSIPLFGAGQGNNNTPIVAVIDSGLVGTSIRSRRHQDIDYSKVISTDWDSAYDSADEANDDYEQSGHGSFVAGQICAIINNSKGNVGLMPDVEILPYKINHGESFATSRSIKAIQSMMDKGVDVINMSYSGSGYSDALANICQKATDQGILLIASAGNSANKGNPVQYPASYPGVISVGAIDSKNQRAGFSEYNEYVDIVAPGTNIKGVWYCGPDQYTTKSGTSMAAPMVSSMAAMIKSVDPSVDHDVFMKIIEKTSTDLGAKGRDNYYGYGCVDFYKAYSYIRGNAFRNESISATIPKESYEYTGKAIKPDVTVASSLGFNLRKDVHYSVDYSNNIEAGTAKITITGKGRYAGKIIEKTFKISATTTIKTLTSLSLSAYEYTYCGRKIIPGVSVKFNDGSTAKRGTDYTVSTSNNVDVGTATVTIKGIGDYTETLTATFTIIPRSITDQSDLTFSLPSTQYMYTGNKIKPEVAVSVEESFIPEKDTDYTVSYKNNVDPGIATVTITGKGNYTGKKILNFTISKEAGTKQTITSFTLTRYDIVYDGGRSYPGMMIKFSDNAKVQFGTNCECEFKNNIDVGTASITVRGIGAYEGEMTEYYEITPASIETMKMELSKYLYTYNGREHYPDVSLIDNNGYYLDEGIDYVVEYYDNVDEGTATVEVVGIGNYDGILSDTFEIIAVKPGKGKISTLKTGKKKATLKIGKISNAKYYTIAYKKKGGKYKYITTYKKARVFRHLQSKKCYYFKVRGVNYDSNDEPLYGKWSSLKKVKIK